jgi:hypothetical protein
MKVPLHSRHAGCLAAFTIMVGIQQPGVDERSAAAFLRDLQGRVARDDRAAVASLIRYPLTVLAGGVRIPMTDNASLLQSYDVVFSPALKALIAEAAIPVVGRPAPRTPVIVTAHLVTIGLDAVRIEPIGGELRITRITMPAAAPSPESGGAVGRPAVRRSGWCWMWVRSAVLARSPAASATSICCPQRKTGCSKCGSTA